MTDTNQSNNVVDVSIDVVETEIPSFSFVHYAENKADSVASYDSLVSDQADFISHVYPIMDEAPFIKRNHDDIIQINPNDGVCDLINTLAKKGGIASMNTNKVVGIISQDSSDKFADGMPGFWCPSASPQAAIVTEKTNADDYKEASAAHEIGHTYGLCDEYDANTWASQNRTKVFGCPNGDEDGDGLLDSECIDTYGISDLMGCPINNQDLINDFFYSSQNYTLVNMYGSRYPLSTNYRRWVSNETYSHLISELEGTGKIICTDEELIVISGNVNKSFNMTLDNFYVIKGGCYVNETVESVPENVTVLRIEQKGFGGAILNFLSRIIDFLIIGDGGEVTEIDEMPFVFVMPYGNATTFDFINQSNNVSLAQRNVTPNAPIVNIIHPIGGEILENEFNITWNATDADNDDLYYAILISDDGGGNYTTLYVDLNQTYYELDPNDYRVGSNYVIKVLATDGVNTGDNVTNTFTLGNPLNITELRTIYSYGTSYVFEFIILNNGTTTFTDIQWQFDAGDGTVINSTSNTSLAVGETVFVYAAYNYGAGGNYSVVANASGVAGGSAATDSLAVNVSVNVTGFPDQSKFYVRNSTGGNVAWFGDAGNVVIKGVLEQNSNFQATDNFAFKIRNGGEDVLIIENNGSMYIDGSLFENQGNVTTAWENNDFRVKGGGVLVINVNESGYVFLKGNLVENANSSQLV